MKRGFTLIEVMVALTISASLVLLVHQVFASALDSSGRQAAERARHAAETAAREALRRELGSLDISRQGFSGNPASLRFAAATTDHTRPVELRIADGWLVRRSGHDTDTLLAVQRGTFEYLLSLGADSRWLWQWHSPGSAPVLVRLRLDYADGCADTLLLPIGSRG